MNIIDIKKIDKKIDDFNNAEKCKGFLKKEIIFFIRNYFRF